MLDEEVKFTHLIEIPKREEKTLEKLVFPAVLSCGAVTGFLGAKYGLNFNNFFSLIPGALVGMGLFSGIGITIEENTQNRYERNYIQEEKRKNEEAKKEKCLSTQFNYRGNNLECLIRPDYAEGHIFYMSINDGIIKEPTFSYQPSRNVPLTFRFAVPNFEKNVKEDIEEIFKIVKDEFIERIEREKGIDLRQPTERDYCNELNNYLEICKEKLKLNCKIKYESSKDKLYAIITCHGEYHSDYLGKFATLCSTLMDKAKDIRLKSSSRLSKK